MALYLPNLDAKKDHLEGRTSMHIPGIIHHSSFYETEEKVPAFRFKETI